MSAEWMNVADFPTYDEYKDSGVEWLGEVPKEWEVTPLITKTKPKSITNYPDEELLSVYLNQGVIRFSDVDEKRTNVTSLNLDNYQLVDKGDFVLNNQQAWRGSVGVSSYRGIVSPAYLVLELSENIQPSFANYLFRDQSMVAHYLVNSKGVGTIQRNLYWQHLKRALVILPNEREQTLIAQFLDQKTALIDQAIAIKEQQIKLLNERKQIIIQQAVTQGLNPNAPMKDSGVEWIGQIPEHWEVKKLKFVLEECHERSVFGDETLFMVSQTYGLVVRADYHEKAEVAATNIGNKLVYKNDLVFNKLKAHLGVFFKSEIDEVGSVSPDYAVYRCMEYISDAKYLEVLFRNPLYLKQFIIRSTGIVEGLIRLYTSGLFNISIPVPSLSEQKKIIQFINTEHYRYEAAQNILLKQIQALKEYKTTLINSAVTGKIKITEAMLAETKEVSCAGTMVI